jgi:hypothetical protein
VLLTITHIIDRKVCLLAQTDAKLCLLFDLENMDPPLSYLLLIQLLEHHKVGTLRLINFHKHVFAYFERIIYFANLTLKVFPVI